jgi:hypothetical protein
LALFGILVTNSILNACFCQRNTALILYARKKS